MYCSNLLYSDIAETRQFIRFLRWKDSQRLLFCSLDHEYLTKTKSVANDDDNTYTKMNRFWSYFSEQISTLYDPITKRNYEPISMDPQQWQNSMKYGAKSQDIFMELYFSLGQYKAMQEIIYQCNPLSLNPIISYEETMNQPSIKQKKENGLVILSLYDDMSPSPIKQEEEDGLVILSSYDSDDIHDDDDSKQDVA